MTRLEKALLDANALKEYLMENACPHEFGMDER